MHSASYCCTSFCRAWLERQYSSDGTEYSFVFLKYGHLYTDFFHCYFSSKLLAAFSVTEVLMTA